MLKQQLELVASTFHGFVPDPFPKLDSPGALWGLSERVTAVESCVTLLSLLHHVFQFHELDGSTPKAVPGNCVNVFVPFFSEANAVPLAKTWVSLRKEVRLFDSLAHDFFFSLLFGMCRLWRSFGSLFTRRRLRHYLIWSLLSTPLAAGNGT